MQIQNVKFIDSLNYVPMVLSKLPKAFDLKPTLKKGYLPHLFNTEMRAIKSYRGSGRPKIVTDMRARKSSKLQPQYGRILYQ